MKIFGPRKHETFLGLKIGYHSCRAVELRKEKKDVFLSNYGEVFFPLFQSQPAIGLENLQIKEVPYFIEKFPPADSMAEKIKILFSKMKVNPEKVFVSLPSFLYFTLTLKTSFLPPEKILSFLRQELKKYLTLPLEDFDLGWQIVEGKMSFWEKKELKILVFAILKKYLSYFQEISKILKISLLIEPEFLSLFRLLSKEERLKEESFGLLHFDDECSTFLIIKRNLPFEIKVINVGNFEILQTLMNEARVNFEIAEETRQNVGIEEEILPGRKKITLPFFENIMVETERKIGDLEKMAEEKIEKVYLSGPGAITAGFQDSFQSFLEKKVEFLPFFEKIVFPPDLQKSRQEIFNHFFLPFNAAFRGLEEK